LPKMPERDIEPAEMQSIIKRIEQDRDDLEAWQRLSELVDDPQKKKDCQDQITRIQGKKTDTETSEMGNAATSALEAEAIASAGTATRTLSNLPGGRLPLIAIIVSDLLPVFGILFLHWSMGSVMLVYWVENVIIGLFTVFKIIFASSQTGSEIYGLSRILEHTEGETGRLVRILAQASSGVSRVFSMLFFCVHFGGFCFGHLVFIMALFFPPSAFQPRPLLNILAGLWLPFLGMFISYSIYFYQHYLGDEIYKQVSFNQLMFEPYPRIMALHVCLLFGGFLAISLGSPIWIILLLVALKTGADVLTYRKSAGKRRKRGMKFKPA
jgi:hypothetical protein